MTPFPSDPIYFCLLGPSRSEIDPSPVATQTNKQTDKSIKTLLIPKVTMWYHALCAWSLLILVLAKVFKIQLLGRV